MNLFFNPTTGLLEVDTLSQLGVGQATITSFGIQLISCQNAAQAVALLGLGAGGVISVNAASASTGALTVTGGPITGTGTFTFTVDATLVALAGVTFAANTIAYATGPDAFLTTALSAYGRTLIDDANAAAAQTTLGLVIGTNVQAFSSTLSNLVTHSTMDGSGNFTVDGSFSAGGTIEGSNLTVTAQTGDVVSAGISGRNFFTVDIDGKTTHNTAVGSTGVIYKWQANSSDVLVLDNSGNLTLSGDFFCEAVSCNDGSDIQGLNATNITSGSLPNARLDTDLQSLANNTGSGLWARTGSGTGAARTISGTTNRVTVSNGDGVSGNPAIDISASYVGQSTITTLGTITSGTWTGTTIAVANGGTGVTTSTGSGSNVLSSGASISAPVLVLQSFTVATLPGATTAGRLIYVSDGTSNKRLAVSDGSAWRWPDGNIVS